MIDLSCHIHGLWRGAVDVDADENQHGAADSSMVLLMGMIVRFVFLIVEKAHFLSVYFFSISCASAAPRGPCPVELMYHNGLRP